MVLPVPRAAGSSVCRAARSWVCPPPHGTAIWAAPGTICRQHLAARRPAAALPAPETCPRNPLQLPATFPAAPGRSGISGEGFGASHGCTLPCAQPPACPVSMSVLPPPPLVQKDLASQALPTCRDQAADNLGWLTGPNSLGSAGPGLTSPRGLAGWRVPGLLRHPNILGTGPNGASCALESWAAHLR